MRVALIVARDFVEIETIREVVLSAPEGTEFVIRDREAARDPEAAPPEPGKQHKTIPLVNILRDLHVEPEIMELDAGWKWRVEVDGEEISGDHRSAVRDERIKNECDRVLVFRTPQTKTLEAYELKDWWEQKAWPNVRVIERGKKAKKAYRKGRAVA